MHYFAAVAARLPPLLGDRRVALNINYGRTIVMSRGANKADVTIAELAAAFPAAFTIDPTLVRPVKLGIKDDLFERSTISHRRVAAALRSYCNSLHI